MTQTNAVLPALDAQQQAVLERTSGETLLLAVPGSAKTTVLRYAAAKNNARLPILEPDTSNLIAHLPKLQGAAAKSSIIIGNFLVYFSLL